MKQVVIMPGGFHPFHAGHYALYQQAQEAFPGADVYVAATNDTSTRPFPFAIKEKLAQLAGVAPGHFVQVKSPFQAREITANFNPDDTQLIFIRSEKDANKPPQAGGVKKDGTPAYLQLLKGQTELAPMSKHAYMAYLPTVEFGPGMTSATEIRNAWPRLNEKRKTALVMSLYPKTQKNPALAANVIKMLDMAIGTEVAEQTDDYRAYFKRPEPQETPPEEKRYQGFGDYHDQTQAKKINTDKIRELFGKKKEVAESKLNEFAPDDGGESRKFLPWNEFIGDLEAILGDHFAVKQKVIKSTIQARFVPYDPMEFGPTVLMSYYETRGMGRDKGAVSTRGSIQVGQYFKSTRPGENQLLTGFNLLKGHEFERHFDLTFANLYKKIGRAHV